MRGGIAAWAVLIVRDRGHSTLKSCPPGSRCTVGINGRKLGFRMCGMSLFFLIKKPFTKVNEKCTDIFVELLHVNNSIQINNPREHFVR